MDDRITLAHGLGGPADLPLPPELAIAGAVAALVVSFTILSVAWRKPRYDGATGGSTRARRARAAGRLPRLRGRRCGPVGIVLFLYVAVAVGVRPGPADQPGVRHLLRLVVGRPGPGLGAAGTGLAGDQPGPHHQRAGRAATGSDPERGVYAYPERLGYWPAARRAVRVRVDGAGLPLLHRARPGAALVAVYLALMLIGGALFGTAFYRRATRSRCTPRSSRKLSVWGRRDGVLVVRSPLANLDTTESAPAWWRWWACCSAARPSTRSASRWWWIRSCRPPAVGVRPEQPRRWSASASASALILALGSIATGVDSRTSAPRAARLFAHSVVPIIVGYIVAHYLNYFVEIGWQTLIQASDPLSNGGDLLGTGDLEPSLARPTTRPCWPRSRSSRWWPVTSSASIAAHERAIKVLPKKHQLTGQMPMLLAMISFTVGGLYLLFAA